MGKRIRCPKGWFQVLVIQDCGPHTVLVKRPGEPPVSSAVEVIVEGGGDTLEEAYRRASAVARERNLPRVAELIEIEGKITPPIV